MKAWKGGTIMKQLSTIRYMRFVMFEMHKNGISWKNITKGLSRWNIRSNVHFSNGSQTANIDGKDLADEHIWDSCMCKRTCNFRTIRLNRYKNIAWQSRKGAIIPWNTQKSR